MSKHSSFSYTLQIIYSELHKVACSRTIASLCIRIHACTHSLTNVRARWRDHAMCFVWWGARRLVVNGSDQRASM